MWLFSNIYLGEIRKMEMKKLKTKETTNKHCLNGRFYLRDRMTKIN